MSGSVRAMTATRAKRTTPRARRGGRTRATALALVLAGTVAGCGEDGAADREPVGGTAVVAFAGGPRTANPLLAADAYSQEMTRALLFLPLLELGPDLELAPRLAESWTVENDSTVVFRLRRDVRWSDGTPTTAHDVVFTLERARDPATGYPNAAQIAHWTAMEAVDSFTVRARVDPVREPLLSLTLLPVVPRHVLDTVPAEAMASAAFNLRPVGNGPFHVAEARPNDRWVFVADSAFPEALGGRPRLDRLVWRVIPESAAQAAELLAGDVDLVSGARPEAFDAAGSRPGVWRAERPTLSYTAVAWNGRRPPLDDPRTRRALGLAVDRREILDALRGGRGTLAAGPVPPEHWAFAGEVEPLGHDPVRARSLLAEAGLEDRDGDGTVEDGSGAPFRPTLLIPAGSDFNRDLAQVIQAPLAEVGVALEIRPLDFATMVGIITAPSRDFDAALLTLDADLRLDLRSLFHGDALDGPFQVAGYADARLDSILDAIEASGDREEAGPLWAAAQARLVEDQPWTFLYYVTDLIIGRDRLRGVEPDLRGLLHDAPRWWVEPGAPDA